MGSTEDHSAPPDSGTTLPDRDVLPKQRSLFSYLTADAAGDYIAIMRLFTSTLLADLSARDVATQLAEHGITLDPDTAEDRCRQLVIWGNLVRSVRDTRVPTIADYHRSRSRYLVSKLGGRLHREAEEILHSVEGAREVARELLARIVDSLDSILVQIGNTRREINSDALAGPVTGVFNDHRVFTESVTDFYAYLSSVLSRYDLAGEEYAQFKGLLLDYIDLIAADVNRNSPVIAERLSTLLTLVDRVVDNLPTVPAMTGDLLVVERSPGRVRSDWEQLAAWYGGTDGRSGPDQLRAAARQALGQLITNAKRMLASSGTGISRRADLLKLARWFHEADTNTAHRLYDAAFGSYPARHLLLGPEEPDRPWAGPSDSWWESDPVDVPISLRERGDRAARGRTAAVPDPGMDRERLLVDVEERNQARRAAAAELAAVGPLDNCRLSRAARNLLMDRLADLLASATDLGLVLWAEPRPGHATVVTSDDGTVTIHDIALVALPLHRVGRPLGRLTVAPAGNA